MQRTPRDVLPNQPKKERVSNPTPYDAGLAFMVKRLSDLKCTLCDSPVALSEVSMTMNRERFSIHDPSRSCRLTCGCLLCLGCASSVSSSPPSCNCGNPSTPMMVNVMHSLRASIGEGSAKEADSMDEEPSENSMNDAPSTLVAASRGGISDALTADGGEIGKDGKDGASAVTVDGGEIGKDRVSAATAADGEIGKDGASVVDGEEIGKDVALADAPAVGVGGVITAAAPGSAPAAASAEDEDAESSDDEGGLLALLANPQAAKPPLPAPLILNKD
jgi:hypothetical protein